MAKIKQYDRKPKFTRTIILLHPNIPKPMHGTNPRSVMGKEWWDINRKKAYAKNNLCCFACGVHKSRAKYHQWLEGHESYKINYQTGKMVLQEIVALCHSCHNFIHSGRMEHLVNKRQMTYQKYEQIINHGNEIVETIPSYIIPSTYEGFFAPWKEWHLEIDDEKFYSKFANQAEWERYYG